METPVSLMMHKRVWTASTEDTIERVDEILISHQLSSVPVVDPKGAVFGILSAPDLMRWHAERDDPRTKAVRAWEICTYRPVEVRPDTPMREVAELMVRHKIHHVLVTEDHLVKGIVSALDFVEQYVLKGSPEPSLPS